MRFLVGLIIGFSLFCADAAFAEKTEFRFKKKFTGPPISIDLVEANIHSVLRIFSEVTNTNIVAHPDVNGKVQRLRLIEVPVDQAFEVVLRTYELYAVDEGNVTIVYPIQTYIKDALKRRELKSRY